MKKKLKDFIEFSKKSTFQDKKNWVMEKKKHISWLVSDKKVKEALKNLEKEGVLEHFLAMM